MNKIHRLSIAACTVIASLGLYSCKTADKDASDHGAKDTNRPNVIIIVADQMRRHSMGIWQQAPYTQHLDSNSDPVVTPTLDALAKEGLSFTDAIANYPLCSPFRGMLLSGLYPNKNGVTNNTRTDRPQVGLRTDITTLTEVLVDNGYNTALVGKGHWHTNSPVFDQAGHYVGSEEAPGGHFIRGTRYDTFIPKGPARNGIEYWYQSIGHRHQSPTVYTNDTQLSGKPEGQPFYPRVYSAVDQANVIIDYIENNRDQRQDTKPFSILWTMDPPHSPYTKISDTDATIYQQHYRDVPLKTLLNRPNVNLERANVAAGIHFSMITLIDREIGRVRAALKQQGLDDNTLIVVTSDHGEMMGSHGKMAKNVYYEESIGIPLIIHYPQKVIQGIDDLLIGVPDFMPTILGLLSLESKTPRTLHGKNYAPLLVKDADVKPARPASSLYYGAGKTIGVRTHQYTYILGDDGFIVALFDNNKDPYQLNPLAISEIPENDFNFLKAELGQWLTTIDHPWVARQKYSHVVSYPITR